MSINQFNQLIIKIIIFCAIIASSLTTQAENNVLQKFNCETTESLMVMDFKQVDDLLSSSVLEMGRSKRTKAARADRSIGTHLSQSINASTDNEGNRFSFEIFNSVEQITRLSDVRKFLENVPGNASLCLFNKKEQLAYWLNLHNVALINEIVKVYPMRNLQSMLEGDVSILIKKILTVADVSVSLNDIRQYILPNNYNKDPLIIYGLYSGNIGSPDILKQAFTGKNVYPLLKTIAADFINSNRGTSLGSGSRIRVSGYYQRNAQYFSDFQSDLKQHLLSYVEGDIEQDIKNATFFIPDIDNWKVADLYGTTNSFGESVSSMDLALLSDSRYDSFKNPRGVFAKSLSSQQLSRLKELMQVRAKNFGSTSVTVSDIEPMEDN